MMHSTECLNECDQKHLNFRRFGPTRVVEIKEKKYINFVIQEEKHYTRNKKKIHKFCFSAMQRGKHKQPAIKYRIKLSKHNF